MTRFDWQTEEEDAWKEPVGDPSPPDRGRRRWLTGLLVLALLAGAAYFLVRETTQQVEEVTADLEAEVLSSHRLLREAAARRDTELLVNLLSGRDAAWTATQQQLLEEGVLFDRPGLGLHLLPSQGEGKVEVSLSPDLAEAEVVTEQSYAIAVGSGLTETVRLQQTTLYRQGTSRWLYAPPENGHNYWGGWATEQGRFLTLTYPQRDEEIALRLAADLEMKLAQLSSQAVELVPATSHVFVRLEWDPQTLSLLAKPESAWQGAAEIVLPTPGLVGLPVEDAGYRALSRGYAAFVISRVISQRLGYECCEKLSFYRPLLEKQLVDLGLKSWPLLPRDYPGLLAEMHSLEWFGRQWGPTRAAQELTEGERMLFFAFSAFLMERAPVVTLQQALVQARRFEEWLPYGAGDSQEERTQELAAAWRRFMVERVEMAQMTWSWWPGPPPEADLLALCRPDTDGATLLSRYDLQTSRWRRELTIEEPAWLSPLPDRSGGLIVRYPTGESGELLYEEGQSLLWRGGALSPTANPPETAPVHYFVSGREDPQGQYVLTNVVTNRAAAYRLLDLSSCDANGCAWISLPDRPIWSADGSRLLTRDHDGVLQWSDRTFQFISLGVSGEPLWIGDEDYAYLRGYEEIWTNPLEGTAPRPVLQLSQLAPLLPETQRADRLELSQFLVLPQQPDSWLLAVRGPVELGGSLFLVENALNSPEITLLFSQEREIQRLLVSADGRWLVAQNYGDEPLFTLYDLQQQTLVLESSEAHAVDFSRDSRWLLLYRDFIELLALPGADGSPNKSLYREFIWTELDSCGLPVWIEE